jgi:uncharacterized protein (DUF2164 family)
MTIKLNDDARGALIESIKRYFLEQLDEEIGELKARMFLDYVLAEIAPVAYNLGVRDAQSWIQDKVLEVDGSVYEPERT